MAGLLLHGLVRGKMGLVEEFMGNVIIKMGNHWAMNLK